MSKIFFFSIPAWGHTNPTIPVVSELVKRGHTVRYYSFTQFKEKIEHTGAEFVCCDSYLPDLNKAEINRIKKVSTTQMTITDLETTARMDEMLSRDVKAWKPDCIVADSVCFWGKLIAKKYQLPFVCSTTTFAFNQHSSRYMQNSFRELADMILGLPKISRALKKLEPLGYHIKNAMEIVQNDNHTNTIVYTSRNFQPCAETFSDCYAFVGPSVKVPVCTDTGAQSQTSHSPSDSGAVSTIRSSSDAKRRKQIYISMGTILNEQIDFYKNCITALKDIDAEVIISIGNAVNPDSFGDIPKNISLFPSVDQIRVLTNTDVFLTHCGMNSISESLYLGVPVVMYPQTGEQKAVAKRTFEMGAGIYLKNGSAEEIRNSIMQVLSNTAYQKSAQKIKEDFQSCPGPAGAADFIEKIIRQDH